MINHPEITLEVTKTLPLEDFITFYTISKDLHYVVNQRMNTFMYAHAEAKAPESAKIFVHRCYRTLCIRDPVARRMGYSAHSGVKFMMQNHPSEQARAQFNEIRFVPSFRWLQMILFREAVVYDIIRSLDLEGHRMPPKTSVAIKKIWFMMDLPFNHLRIAMMHNSEFWTEEDLYNATMFFIKLDMRFTDPVVGSGNLAMRKMLIGQRSLTTLADVLHRVELRDQVDMLRMILQYDYRPSTPLAPGKTLLGVPEFRFGKLSRECWGMRGHTARFVPVDGCIMRECVRRGMDMANAYLDMMMYGYVDRETLEDIRTPETLPNEALLGDNVRFFKDLLGDYDTNDEAEEERENQLLEKMIAELDAVK